MSKAFNRPISPHLSIYIPQHSSLFSIWHRISGVVLAIILFFTVSIPEIFFTFELTYFLFKLPTLAYWITEFNYIGFILVFSYHGLNGFRHIIWDLLLYLKQTSIKLSSVFLIIFMSIILMRIILIF
uniref:Succinate:cytochrome c oxidoreductase subunit 3 n=1 Tax=Rhodymenia pseudopalmata TaxID=31502 RepID=V9NEV8_RHOPU|nr:succinate:cytochrome c oxidoreductase subunit 3 [Rhodymenia pseudopalmata]AGO19267.1 succinate:cytochrome c oxidoreductase subunit 3 [Rhodymenia pseudopalmata]